jgi:hypothetical protein
MCLSTVGDKSGDKEGNLGKKIDLMPFLTLEKNEFF